MSRFVLGIDENGLGPRLGPLLVTAVALEAAPGAEQAAMKKPTPALAARLGDSKALVKYGGSSLGEAWARAIAARLGVPAGDTPSALLRTFSLDPDAVLRARCPGEHARQCWGADGESFTSSDADVAQAAKDLERLAKRGLTVRAVRIAIVCTERLNDAARRGISRFQIDLHTMERLVLALRGELDEDVVAICGKVGGYDRYGDAFGPLGGRLHMALVEGRAKSEYRFPGVGTLSFVRDADDSHLVVSLASLVGKWARDMLMGRIVRYHREATPDLPDASGYHDPVTAEFVAATALTRKKSALPDTCFEREKADDVRAKRARDATPLT